MTIASVGVAVDDVGRVDDLAVDLAGERGFGEARADGGGDVGDGNGCVELLDGAVGQSNGRHGGFLKQKKCGRAALFRRTGTTACELALGYRVSVRVRGVITMPFRSLPSGVSYVRWSTADLA